MLSNPCTVMTFFVIRFRKGCDPSLLLVIRNKRFISLHSTKLSLFNMGRYTTDSETSVITQAFWTSKLYTFAHQLLSITAPTPLVVLK